MIAHIQFRHLGVDVKSLLVFNFAAVKDVIMVVPESAESLKDWTSQEKEEGIVFTRTQDGSWICPLAAVNRYPETFSQLRDAMLQYFSKDKFSFRRRAALSDGKLN